MYVLVFFGLYFFSFDKSFRYFFVSFIIISGDKVSNIIIFQKRGLIGFYNKIIIVYVFVYYFIL